MSYFSYFTENIQNDYSDSDAIKGTCNSMCPEEEIALREKERLVHVLEVWGPIKKFVKSYSRSAADSNIARPHLLRPFAVLKETVQFLILDITKRPESSSCIYNFIDDRLRAVRQDMTIQRLPPQECATLLEPMIRFYVFYGYKLSSLPQSDFDPVLNKKYLLECMKLFLSYSDGKDENEISGLLSNLNLNINYKLKCDRVLVESLYIICNLNSSDPLLRYLLMPKDLKRHPKLQLAFKIALANYKGNYVAVCTMMDQLCPLSYYALYVHLPALQRRALLVMSHAYNSKSLTVPAHALRRWLRYHSDSDVIDACAHYGLKTKGDLVTFQKADFRVDVAVVAPKILYNKLDMSIDDIFTYTSNR